MDANELTTKISELNRTIEDYKDEMEDLRESLAYYRKQCEVLKEKVNGAKYMLRAMVKDFDEGIL